MKNDACDSVFIPQLGPDDVTDGTVENYDMDWPLTASERGGSSGLPDTAR